MNKINKLFINTTWSCNMDCPRCYIPKNLRDDHQSRLDHAYLTKMLRHESISQDSNTVVMYMGGEATTIGKKSMKSYINAVAKILPNARHTVVTNLFHLPNWLIDMSVNQFQGQIETTYANGQKQTLSGNEQRYQEKFINNLKQITCHGINCTVNVELNKETYSRGIEPIIATMQTTKAKDWAFDYSVNFDEFNAKSIYDDFDYPVLKGSLTLKEYWDFVSAVKQHNWAIVQGVRITPRVDGFNVMEGKNFLTINPNNTVTTNPLFSTMQALQYSDIDTMNQSNMREKHQRRAVSRIRPCVNCNEFYDCQGFSAHVPIQQEGICAGGLSSA